MARMERRDVTSFIVLQFIASFLFLNDFIKCWIQSERALSTMHFFRAHIHGKRCICWLNGKVRLLERCQSVLRLNPDKLFIT